MSVIHARPVLGGQLMTHVSSENAGIQNWTVARDWRFELDGMMRREGCEYFWPNNANDECCGSNFEDDPGDQPFPNRATIRPRGYEADPAPTAVLTGTTLEITFPFGHGISDGEDVIVNGGQITTATVISKTVLQVRASDVPTLGFYTVRSAELLNLVHQARRPNGQTQTIVGTRSHLFRFAALNGGPYIEGNCTECEYIYTPGEDAGLNGLPYFNDCPGEWEVIGSGFSIKGHRWEHVNINGYSVFNNAYDLPVTYRVEESFVIPIYELREQGVASVGTIAEHFGILVCGDISEFKSGYLPVLLALQKGGFLPEDRSGAAMALPMDSNTPPTITAIGNITINQGTSTAPIAFTIGDAEDLPADLSLIAISSDPVLLPSHSMVFGGSGTARTLTITPPSSQSGTATVTVFVHDGKAFTSTSFLLTVTLTNQLPKISSLPPYSTATSTATPALPFSVYDLETAVGSLTVTGTSSNHALVLDASIVFGGAGANRTVTITPETGITGTATITLTVSDGTSTAASVFVLSVPSAGTPPVISTVPAVTTPEDTVTPPQSFTVSDVDIPPENIVVFATSNNPALVLDAGIVIGGSGTNRTVTVQPVQDQIGTATIRLYASDGVTSRSSTFVITVTAVNDVPFISTIPPVTTLVSTATGAIPFTIWDSETAPGTLTLTATSSNHALIPDASVVLGGSLSNRTATITPIPGEIGTSNIRITVSDGTNTRTSQFTVTVQSPSNILATTYPFFDLTVYPHDDCFPDQPSVVNRWIGRTIVFEDGQERDIVSVTDESHVVLSSTITLVGRQSFTVRTKFSQSGSVSSAPSLASTYIGNTFTATVPIFTGLHVGSKIRLASGFVTTITGLINPQQVFVSDAAPVDLSFYGHYFWIIPAIANRLTAAAPYFTPDMVGLKFYAADGSVRTITKYLSPLQVEVDSDSSILLGIGGVENPDAYAAITDASRIDRRTYRVIWSALNEPRNWGAHHVGTILSGSNIFTLSYPQKSLDLSGPIQIRGAGSLGALLQANAILLSNGGLRIVLDQHASTTARNTYFLTSDSTGSFDSIVGFEDLQDDSSGIVRMMDLDGTLVIYKATSIFLANFTGDFQNPFTFRRREYNSDSSGSDKSIYYRNTLINTGRAHIYAGRQKFYVYTLSDISPNEMPGSNVCDDVFFDPCTSHQDGDMIFACDNQLAKEIWFVRPVDPEVDDKTVCWSYAYNRWSTSSMLCVAGGMVEKPVNGITIGPAEKWFLVCQDQAVMQYGLAHECRNNVWWLNKKSIFYRRNYVAFSTAKVAYDSLIQSGMEAFGESYHEKEVKGYVPILASSSGNVQLFWDLLGCRNTVEQPSVLYSYVFANPAAMNLKPLFFQTNYFGDRILVTGVDNPVKFVDRIWEITGVASASFIRRNSVVTP